MFVGEAAGTESEHQGAQEAMTEDIFHIKLHTLYSGELKRCTVYFLQSAVEVLSVVSPAISSIGYVELPH